MPRGPGRRAGRAPPVTPPLRRGPRRRSRPLRRRRAAPPQSDGAERRVPELSLARRPRAHVGIGQGVAGVARRHAVVDLIRRDAQVEVLGPENRVLRRCEPPKRLIAAREPVEQQPGLGRVDDQLVVRAEFSVLRVEISGFAGLDSQGGPDVADRAAHRYPATLADHLDALDPQRPLELPEAAGRHPEPDLAVLPADAGGTPWLLTRRPTRQPSFRLAERVVDTPDARRDAATGR